MPPVLLTVPEVAARLRLSRPRVYDRLYRGEIGYIKSPKGHIRVDEAELDAYIKRITVPARPHGQESA